MVRARPRDGLDTCNPGLGESRRRRSENKLRGADSKFRETGDGEVFVVESFVVQENASRLSGSEGASQHVHFCRKNETDLFDHRQDPRLVIVIAIRADTQVDLLLKRILLVRGSKLEDAATTRIDILN